jgi:hypothetical protein
MNRLHVSTAALALLACLVFPSGASASRAAAQPLPRAQGMNFTLEGKITRQSPGRLTVTTGENIIFRIRYDEETKILRKDGTAGSEKDLRVGATIRVEGDLTESGEVVALKIEVQAEPPAKPR